MAVRDPFRLHVKPPVPEGWLRYDKPGLLLGSCFAAEVGERLERDGFEATINPFGTAYNPITTLQSLTISWEDAERGLVERDGIFTSHLTHSDVWAKTKEEFRAAFSLAEKNRDEALERVHWFSLTLGTAWVYTRRSDELLCANLHKRPAAEFERRLLSVEEIIQVWQVALEELRARGLKHFLITVSPVIHGKDGLSENSLSKAVLRLAAEKMATGSDVHYFPALEIVRDELRDYRFYAEDMQHPSSQAADIVYERFLDFALADSEREVLGKYRALAAFSRHRAKVENAELYAQKIQQVNELALPEFTKNKLIEDLKRNSR